MTGKIGDRLERAILLTVLYADLFDYPLTREELYARLVALRCDAAAVDRALFPLVGSYLSDTDGYLTWSGREHLVAVRRRRTREADRLWTVATRYARWLALVPFVRMVAVSGSLAVRNSEANTDVDFFCITEPHRLWLARAFIVPLSKLTRIRCRLFPEYLCANYVLAMDELEIETRNLYTACEIAQAVPLWGREGYRRFHRANAWIRGFLPQARPQARLAGIGEPRRPWLTREMERLLGGRPGDLLDRWLHRVFVSFYRRRARRRHWSWEPLAEAYRPGRYTVPWGGYLAVIRRRFQERVHERLGTSADGDIDRLFADDESNSGEYPGDWEARFARDYGREPVGVVSVRPPSTTADEPAFGQECSGAGSGATKHGEPGDRLVTHRR